MAERNKRKQKALQNSSILTLGVDELRKQELREKQRQQKQAINEKITAQFAEAGRLYVHPKVAFWHEMVTTDSDGEEFTLSMAGQGVGFMAVFLDEASYRETFPDMEPMVYEIQIRSKRKATNGE